MGPGAGRGMAAASLTGCKTAKERRKTPKNSHQTSQILTGGSGVAEPREGSRGMIHPKIHVVGNEGVGPWGAARSLTGGTIQGPLDEAARAGWVHPWPGGSDRESWSSATSTMAEATPGMGRRQLEGENCSLEGLHPSLCPQMGSGKGPQSQARHREQPGSASTSAGKENPRCPLTWTLKSGSHPHPHSLPPHPDGSSPSPEHPARDKAGL